MLATIHAAQVLTTRDRFSILGDKPWEVGEPKWGYRYRRSRRPHGAPPLYKHHFTKNNYIYDINTITNPYFTRMKNGITSNNSYSLIVGLSVSMMGMMMSMRRCKCRV